MTIDLHLGDCIDVMRSLEENSVDAIITDPPYELGFMGKSWDSTGIAFNVEVWKEALRVLKPGGHLLAFSGSRTYHRMAVAIEDAGFEIRDQIMWIYGSGFPKSLDVSKAIDKSDAVEKRIERQLKFCYWMRSTGLTASKATEILRSAKVISENGTMAGHFFATSIDGQPAVATKELFDAMRPYLPEVPEWVEQMVRERTIESENFKKREVVGKYETDMGGLGGERLGNAGGNITIPSTAAAKQWQGWGTALKPAHEPIVVARKPLIGTVAANVLTYGTGGLNIDGARVGNEGGTRLDVEEKDVGLYSPGSSGLKRGYGEVVAGLGRWPANVIHDGSDEVVELFPNSKGGAYPAKRGNAVNTSFASGQETEGGFRAMGDDGSAARFFYCAKANKRDRNEGLESFQPKRDHDGRQDGNPRGSNPRNRTNTPKVNHHPTVKPTDLMRYLCRLVTPPQGIILDPFMGSGSTGKAAILEGFNFIGIEMQHEYLDIARARIYFAERQEKEKLL